MLKIHSWCLLAVIFMRSFPVKYSVLVTIFSAFIQLFKLKSELREVRNNPQGLLLEAIHSAGYAGALANPLLAPESMLNRLDSTVLEEFIAENYTAPRIVLAASGVDLDELLPIAEPLLSDLPKLSRPVEPKSVYVGGDYRQQADSQSTHVALAFGLPGGWLKEKEAVILTVLQFCRCLWEEVVHFQLEAPEKGCTHVSIHSFSAFNSIFNNTGLFGIYASTDSDFVSKAVDLSVRELIAIATPAQVTEAQLNRAKEATKSAVLMNLESRMIVSEDIGRQILTYGERKPVDHFLKAVDAINLNDITNVGQKIISSPLTMASYGDVINVPSYESVSSKFRPK
ncbi:hypothetical protein Pint_29570 [Pistacia integerrima]|uniref:Uncharacterized protein n=1 Tax=Pistacia integerrima TaxID=434235 RepID=A0ACC0X0C1_9ROSI|nr:hypothetical protein Pint_29570 [Pistacia integerrima]